MKTIAIDYGTSNCAASFVNNGEPHLVELEPGSSYLPSVLWVPRSPVRHIPLDENEIEAVADSLRTKQACKASGLAGLSTAAIHQMAHNIVRRDAFMDAIQDNRTQNLSATLIRSSEVLLGTEALQMHMEDPSLGYLIKSPKNFLAVDLIPEKIELFVAITAVFLRYLKNSAELALGEEAELIVLGRPVKYHGSEAFEPSALDIMHRAAIEAGIDDFVFEFEPIAAAVAYEHQLVTHKTVMVLDAGGGTTDVTLMQLGPERQFKADRRSDILSTTGERLGGTDIDVTYAKHFFAPALGAGSHFKTGLPLPKRSIFDALSVTDIPAQTRFYSKSTARELHEYLRDVDDQIPLRRLIELRDEHLSMRVNRSAEQGKIGLTDADQVTVALDYFTDPIDILVTRAAFDAAIQSYIEKIIALMLTACSESGTTPDEIFMTGGTSKIPLMNQRVHEHFPDVTLVSGDDFGSVVKGLAIRAAALANAKQPAGPLQAK